MTAMNRNRRQSNPYDLIQGYGPDYRSVGILSEHLHLLPNDWYVKVLRGGAEVVVDPGGHAHFVLCSELVPDVTEDGPVVVRCGARVTGEVACEGHQADIEHWRAMSEIERAAWERKQERER